MEKKSNSDGAGWTPTSHPELPGPAGDDGAMSVHPDLGEERIEHEEFAELCALSAAGSLSADQAHMLDAHLRECEDCRRVRDEFEQIASMGLPALAPEFAEVGVEVGGGLGMGWPTERTQDRILARIEHAVERAVPSGEWRVASENIGAKGLRPKADTAGLGPKLWARRLLPYAAAAVVVVGSSLATYELGVKRSATASLPQIAQAETRADALRAQINQLEQQLDKERGEMNGDRATLAASDRKVSELEAEVKDHVAEIATLQSQEANLQSTLQSTTAEKTAAESERIAANRKMQEEQAALETAQGELNSVRAERNSQLLRIGSLETRVLELSASVKDRDQTVQEQKDYLAADRDIRNLIAARDLYVAEVNDVGRDGGTEKPFGRVFYTKGKSLIFYAYDLDQQAGLKRASTFQAWGRTGQDFSAAMPMGILYLDGASNHRWVLRFDNPAALQKIDAVFVTVEPKGGSKKPTGKPLLFAYLKVEPNHP